MLTKMWIWLRNTLTQQNVKRVRVKAPIELDVVLLFLVLGLLAFGWLMVTSASIVMSGESWGNPLFYSTRQGIYALMGIGLIALSLFVPTDNFQKLDRTWLIVAFILLVAVLIPGIGREVNGSRRWIPLVMINVQVSEVVKLCAIMYFSGYLVRFGDYARKTFQGVAKPLAILAVMAGFLLMQPDFGASVVMFACVFGIMVMGGVQWRWFGFFIILASIAAVMLIISAPYRMHRLTGFLDPWSDAQGSGYQLVQSLIAFGRGGFFGDGLGMSIQKQFFLPEAHTDFITAIIAEELGAIGVLVLLGVYSCLVWRGLKIGRLAGKLNRPFQSYVSYGISFWVAFQVFVNLGVNMGMLPTKGLTLPLISYGGSSLLIMCFALGILLRIDFENKVISDQVMPQYIYKRMKQ